MRSITSLETLLREQDPGDLSSAAVPPIAVSMPRSRMASAEATTSPWRRMRIPRIARLTEALHSINHYNDVWRISLRPTKPPAVGNAPKQFIENWKNELIINPQV